MEAAIETVLAFARPYGVATEYDLIMVLAWTMLCTGIAVFFALRFVNVPYGKYQTNSAWYWGFPVNAKVAWIVQECPSFLVAAYCWYTAVQKGERKDVLTNVNQVTVLLTMYLVHYFNRSFVYPLRIRGGKPTPFWIMMMAVVFCFYNGYLQGQYLSLYSPAHRLSLASPRFILGVALWAAGWYINLDADHILRTLRKPGETGYKIPYGGAFNFVSGANFFGEILEWTGFAVAGWSIPALAFAAFTALNIGPRGAQHHAYYQKLFGDKYPRDRKAVIPFIW